MKENKQKFVTRTEVLKAHKKDPSGNLLADLLVNAGIAARVKSCQEWKLLVPLPAP